MGAALAYYSLPAIFQWLINQAGTATIQNMAEDYFSLLALMVFAFGLSFAGRNGRSGSTTKRR